MRKRSFLVFVLVIVILVPLAWLYLVKFEGEHPVISLDRKIGYLGKHTRLSLTVKDRKSGIRKIVVKVVQKGKEPVVMEKSFPLSNWFVRGGVGQQKIQVDIEPLKLGIHNGKAVLACYAWDHSLRGWFKGNKGVLEKEVVVDTVPPVVSVVSNTQYLNQGGSGVVCFTVSEESSRAGVQVADLFFPGFPLKPPSKLYAAYMAVPYDRPKVSMKVQAMDLAENQGQSDFFHRVKRKAFRKDTLRLSDSFLKMIQSRFVQRYPDLGSDPLQVFLKVNKELREQNNRQIREICSRSAPRKMWEGAFVPLPKAEARARFADSRVYLYQGRKVATSVHLGVDLASLANSPVPAGNNGVVIWAQHLGIYGNTVVIDHGQGLFSMYAHLSTFKVKKGDSVKKGQVLGLTGFTGLAGGDHLHFGMYVWGIPVNPVEWWDPRWVKKKILQPLKMASKLQ